MKIEESIKKVRNYPKEMEKITFASLKKNETVIAKMNVQQMEIGKKPDGTWQDYYSPATQDWPGRVGDATGRIKLKDTGEFHESVLSKTKAWKGRRGRAVSSSRQRVVGIEFQGIDKYDLESDYGPIFGLTEENLKKVTEIVASDLYKGEKQYWK